MYIYMCVCVCVFVYVCVCVCVIYFAPKMKKVLNSEFLFKFYLTLFTFQVIPFLLLYYSYK